MNFQDFSQKASCPYNKNHIFDKQKLMFHINRCKDKEKVGHLFAFCQYNRIHIVPKQDIATHEIMCPDRDQIKNLTQQLKSTIRQTQEQRQRSRQKVKKEQLVKKQVKIQHSQDHILLQQCPLCQKIIQKLQQIKKVVPNEVLLKIKNVQKLIKMNNQLRKADSSLKKQQVETYKN